MPRLDAASASALTFAARAVLLERRIVRLVLFASLVDYAFDACLIWPPLRL